MSDKDEELALSRRVAFTHATAWFDLGVGEPPNQEETRTLVAWLDECRDLLARVLDATDMSSTMRDAVRACRMGNSVTIEKTSDGGKRP